MQRHPPQTEAELIERVNAIAGLTMTQLASQLGLIIPAHPLQRKGWVGQALELALGANAGNRSLPDFCDLAIELKTLPLHQPGKPAESTFVASIPLLTIHHQSWRNSQCYAKLRRVLWVPVEADESIAFPERRLGQGVLWSPTQEQEAVLASDWEELVMMICSGQLSMINASYGVYLHVRPKASDSKALCYAFDASGRKIRTLPRGFYLRTQFTASILGGA